MGSLEKQNENNFILQMRNLDLPRDWVAQGTLFFSGRIWGYMNVFLSVYACIFLVLLVITDIPESPVGVAHEFIFDTLDWSLFKLLGMSTLSVLPKVFCSFCDYFQGKIFFSFWDKGRGSHFVRIIAKKWADKNKVILRCGTYCLWICSHKPALSMLCVNFNLGPQICYIWHSHFDLM